MQFRAYRVHGLGLILDLQTDLIDLPSRVVAPLVALAGGPRPLTRLEPVLQVDGVPHVLRASQLLTVPRKLAAGQPVADLRDQDYAIRGALDMIFSGF